MATPEYVAITGAVEGDVDEAVVRCLIEHVNAKTLAIYGRNGKSHLHRRLASYNQAARFSRWFVLVDLDLDAECAPPFRESWLSKPSRSMCFRIAVRAVESWLMAERLIEFVTDTKIGWRPEVAARHSESLKRCLCSLRRLKEISV